MHLKMGEVLWTVHMRRAMVARGPKLIFDQMAAPVPEIMDGFLYSMMSKSWLSDK
jgi:hypothetical protein